MTTPMNLRLAAALELILRYRLYHDGVSAYGLAGGRTECFCSICADAREFLNAEEE